MQALTVVERKGEVLRAQVTMGSNEPGESSLPYLQSNRRADGGWRIYNVVGCVKYYFGDTTPSARWGRGQGRAQRVHRRPLTPPPARPHWRRDEARVLFPGLRP